MPIDSSITKVLLIGSGPIIIGQGAEFDYSGTQASLALKEENITGILVNSNPATIMTDSEIADFTYIEPLNISYIEQIIKKEKPSHVLATMGGQTALNLALELHQNGILDKNSIKFAGTGIESIKKGEDRREFKELMNLIGEPTLDGEIVTTIDEGLNVAKEIGYPLIIRPAYTLGGTGGGFCNNEKELRTILSKALIESAIGEALIEKSVKGFKEIEFEIVRDNIGNSVIVCAMENLDPIGIHTGDSIVVAPTLTLSDKLYQMLRSSTIKIANAVDIKGGCNVQFALDPESYKYYVIEINPRVSRSSALASKATGYQIANVATKIALGLNLDEIKNEVTQKTYACFEPSIDYIVVKIPKWPFDKFISAKRELGTKMMATGEIMSIGKTFEQALLKAIRSLDMKQCTLDKNSTKKYSIEQLKNKIKMPDDERLFYLAELIRRGYSLYKISEITGIGMFFLVKIKNIVIAEETLKDINLSEIDEENLRRYKQMGFSDRGMGELLRCSPDEIYKLRKKFKIFPNYNKVDTCSGEFEATSSYYYSNYDGFDETTIGIKQKVLVVGSGPIKIGQAIEFDYSSTKCAKTLKKFGFESIMINNNPETVSTDFNMSDKLYFEPLTQEEVLNVIKLENPYGVILQFGGQTAIKLAKFLESKNVKILGTKAESIDISEDREKFDNLLEELDIKRPLGKAVIETSDGIETAKNIGYPVLVRPSYVIGGQGMEIIENEKELETYLSEALKKDDENTILIDKYLEGMELEIDAICDGNDIFIPGIIEHIDRAGVHSGDSMSIYPAINVTKNLEYEIINITKKISKALHIIGLINIQFIYYESKLYVIEINPRASRTIPFLSKVTKLDISEIATRVLIGHTLKEMGFINNIHKKNELFFVKFAIFSTNKLPEVEISLGPEMRSTGEVLGIGETKNEAMKKAFDAANFPIPNKGSIMLITISDKEKNFLPYAKRLVELEVLLLATKGTFEYLKENNIRVQEVRKLNENSPNIIDIVKCGVIDLIVNIPQKGNDSTRQGFKLRRIAAENNVSIVTSLDTLLCLLDIMENYNKETINVYELSEIK